MHARLTPITPRGAGHAERGGMAMLDFGDAARPVDILFVHANGFNARTYRTILEPLADSRRILAVDMRGHGRTTLEADAPRRQSWKPFRDDLLGLLESLNGPPVVLAGHSMGGTVALLTAAAAPQRIGSLKLFDPVMWNPLGVAIGHLPILPAWAAARIPLARSALRRRAVFESREAAFKAYHGRGAFRDWPDAMLRDYLADGFNDRADGSVELACRPDWEALNYVTHGHDPYAAVRRFGGPVTILRAARGSTCRIGDVAAFERRYPNATVRTVEGGDHFFPMKRPALVRETLLESAAPAV